MKINILSCFDGISAGQLALQRANIDVENYYASEIDKYAIQITKKNYPDTIHIGDVNNINWNDYVGKIDLLIGGSPCEGFSRCGEKLNFEDPRSKLFFKFVEALQIIKPNYFLFENVKMQKKWQNTISACLCVEPIEINSSLVSAQNRERLYWTNIENIKQPKDKNIIFKDILLDSVDKKFYLSQKEKCYMNRVTSRNRTHWDFVFHNDVSAKKSHCLSANLYKGVPYNVVTFSDRCKFGFFDCDFIDDCNICKDCDGNNFQENYEVTSAVRKFDPIECERLQTLKDKYTEGISNSQRYKTIGNGWTVDVIAHILKHMYSGDVQKKYAHALGLF